MGSDELYDADDYLLLYFIYFLLIYFIYSSWNFYIMSGTEERTDNCTFILFVGH